ncbi:MAG: DUF6291 domain-containing protein [Bacteroidota bacterium]|nr:DUF6291 domain-containing protein [Bacteroidota bacterium]
MKDSFIVYNSFYPPVQGLSDGEKGMLLDAIFQYQTGSKVRELPPVVQMAFNFIKAHFKRDSEKYQNIIERNQTNGLKGGRPKEPKKPSGLINNPDIFKKPTGIFGNLNENESDDVNVNVSENENEKSICVFSDSKLHFDILEYFGFTEQRNPDKLQQISTFLNLLKTDGKIEMFTEQFEAYKAYKEKSTTAKHAFPNFLGRIENRYLDGGWNQENWTSKLTKQSHDEQSPFKSSAVDILRKKILAGEC